MESEADGLTENGKRGGFILFLDAGETAVPVGEFHPAGTPGQDFDDSARGRDEVGRHGEEKAMNVECKTKKWAP
jgi:hypothetical protein